MKPCRFNVPSSIQPLQSTTCRDNSRVEKIVNCEATENGHLPPLVWQLLNIFFIVPHTQHQKKEKKGKREKNWSGELNSEREAQRRRRIWHGTFDKVGVVGVKYTLSSWEREREKRREMGDRDRSSNSRRRQSAWKHTCGFGIECWKKVVEKWVEFCIYCSNAQRGWYRERL